MSIRIMREVFDYAPDDLTSAQKFTLLAVAYDARDHDRIARFSSAEKVAQLANLNYSSARRCLAELAARGLLIRVGGRAYKGRIQQYRVPQLHAYHRAATARRQAADSATLGNAEGPSSAPPQRHLRLHTQPVDNAAEGDGQRSRAGPRALPQVAPLRTSSTPEDVRETQPPANCGRRAAH